MSDFSQDVDTVHVNGVIKPGIVVVKFDVVELNLNPEFARKLAFALMEQADRAEKGPR